MNLIPFILLVKYLQRFGKRLVFGVTFTMALGFITPIILAEPVTEKPGRTARLKGLGIELEAMYTGDLYRSLTHTGYSGTQYLDVIDLIVGLDLGTLIKWNNARLYTDVIVTHGEDPSACVGDMQGISNIAGDQGWKIYELWLQQTLWQNRLSVLAGIYDINSEFDVIEPAGIFLNGSFGMGPDFAQSGGNGAPAYPCTDLGVRIKITPFAPLTIQTAIFDGYAGDRDNPQYIPLRIELDQGTLIASEIIFLKGKKEIRQVPVSFRRGRQQRRRTGRQRLKADRPHSNHQAHHQRPYSWLNIPENNYTKLALGGWYHSGTFDDLLRCDQNIIPLQHKGSWGVYLLAGRTLFRRPRNSMADLNAFARIGLANPKVNPIDRYIGGGLIWSECTGSRYIDQLGLAVAAARTGAPYQKSICGDCNDNQWETVLELTYRIQVNRWLSIQPDLQYIINPGFIVGQDTALAGGMRMELVL